MVESWTGFLRAFALAFGLLLGGSAALIALMNPFGNLPAVTRQSHVIMDGDARFHFPAIVRSGGFDSVVIGNSTSRLLDPRWLESAFGGKFANLGLNDGRAWEQYQLAGLFLREVGRPRTLLFGIDWVWCADNADIVRTSPGRIFPAWIYDDDPWNDWFYALNWKGLENAGKLVLNRVGLLRPRIPDNGFDVFVPPESAYDLAKAREHIWHPNSAPAEPKATGQKFPALAWLDELAARASGRSRIVFAFMPRHVAAQPSAGSDEAAHEAECKTRLTGIANRHGAAFVDFNIASAITTADTNYWDALHYRLPVAERIVRDITTAIRTGRDDPGGDWKYLAAARN